MSQDESSSTSSQNPQKAPQKLKARTPEGTRFLIDALQQLLPSCVTESVDDKGKVRKGVDFDTLRQELLGEVLDGLQERYQLNWPGKKKALLEANVGVTHTLRPQKTASLNFDNTRNVFIEGDNLKALKLLQPSLLGQVKMIYIDPPYNTGKDFIYKDSFTASSNEYAKASAQKNSDDERLVANPEGAGRFHSNWCSMIYPRLKVARHLLRDDGAIFISIDDNEVYNLRKICNEIFGEHNFISQLVWEAELKNNARYISSSHEYILCYAKNAAYLREQDMKWRKPKQGLNEVYVQFQSLQKQYGVDYKAITQGMKAWYKSLPSEHLSKTHSRYCYADKRGLFVSENISPPGGGGARYEVLHPVTKKSVKKPSRGWLFSSPEKMAQLIAEDKIYFGPTESTVPGVKQYLHKKSHTVLPSVIRQPGAAGMRRLRDLMGGDVFPFPKDERVIKDLVSIVSPSAQSNLQPNSNASVDFSSQSSLNSNLKPKSSQSSNLVQNLNLNQDFNSNKNSILSQPSASNQNVNNDIILDFFAGSGTTAHAVMQLNAEDGGRRRIISIQLDEKCDKNSTAFKSGYKTIADIARERIRRAGQKIKAELQVKAQAGSQVLGASSLAKNKIKIAAQSSSSLANAGAQVKSHKNISKSQTFQSDAAEFLDIGFRSFRVDSSNMKDEFYQEVHKITPDIIAQMLGHIKNDRSEEDLLWQAIIELGLPLDAIIQERQICNQRVFFVSASSRLDQKSVILQEAALQDHVSQKAALQGGILQKIALQETVSQGAASQSTLSQEAVSQKATPQEVAVTKPDITPSKALDDKTHYKLIACLSRQGEITRDLALELYKYNCECVVFCEDGFQDDNCKLNVSETFKRLGPKIKLRIF